MCSYSRTSWLVGISDHLRSIYLKPSTTYVLVDNQREESGSGKTFTYSNWLMVMNNQIMIIIRKLWMVLCFHGWKNVTSFDDPYALGWAINYGIQNQWEESGWRAAWVRKSSTHSSWLSIKTDFFMDKIEEFWMISWLRECKSVTISNNPHALGWTNGYKALR